MTREGLLIYNWRAPSVHNATDPSLISSFFSAFCTYFENGALEKITLQNTVIHFLSRQHYLIVGRFSGSRIKDRPIKKFLQSIDAVFCKAGGSTRVLDWNCNTEIFNHVLVAVETALNTII